MKKLSNVGSAFYWAMIYKLNKEEAFAFFRSLLAQEDIILHEDKDYRADFERVMMEFLIISNQEPLPFDRNNFPTMYHFWETIICRLQDGGRLSSWCNLSSNEKAWIREKVEKVSQLKALPVFQAWLTERLYWTQFHTGPGKPEFPRMNWGGNSAKSYTFLERPRPRFTLRRP